MKGNRELDELLIAYILKELNTEDEALVIEYINSAEDHKRHFEELRNTWRAVAIKKGLEKVDVSSEWEQFAQTIAREKQKLIPIRPDSRKEDKAVEENKPGEGYKAIEEGNIRRSGVRRGILSMAIAASVIAVILAGWMLLRDKRPGIAETPGTTENKAPVVASIIKHEANSSGKPRKLVLADGSEVILSDKSEISYPSPFINDKRDITLKGKADFNVTSDKTRPFTVYSSDLATTVLGTRFTVSAYEQAENIIIRLNEGKVVVKSVVNGNVGLKQAYYLLPGQQLVYNNRNYTARLLDFNGKNVTSGSGVRKELAADSPDLPENNKGSWYMFNNQSLEQVFDQLKLLYNANIVYSKSDVHNLYFAGKFDKSDSLRDILNQIASLNNLKVSQKNNTFIISK